MLWPGVRSELLRWESRVQDIGLPQTSQPHIISNGESSPRDLHLSAKTQLHSTTSKLQCCTPFAKQLERQEHNPTHQQRGFLKSKSVHRHTKTHHQTWFSPPERQDPALSTSTQAPVPSTRKTTQHTESTLPTRGRHQKQRDYEPAACKKETQNTVS